MPSSLVRMVSAQVVCSRNTKHTPSRHPAAAEVTWSVMSMTSWRRLLWTVTLVMGRLLLGVGDGLDPSGVVERGEIAGVAAEVGRAHHPAHDLGAAGLGQLAGEQHALRADRLAHRAHDLLHQLAAQRLGGLEARAQHREAHHGLALDLVRDADGGRLRHRGVPHQDRLHLGGAYALARDLEGVVRAALDEPEAILVDDGPVAVHPHAGPARPVGLEVALRILPEAV